MISYWSNTSRSVIKPGPRTVHHRRCSTTPKFHVEEEKDHPLFTLDPNQQIVEPPELPEKLSKEIDRKGWPLEIRWTEMKGRGMFANRKIHKGEVLLRETPFVQVSTSPDFCHNCLRNISKDAYTLPSGADIVLDGIEVPEGLANHPKTQHRQTLACNCRDCKEERYCGRTCEEESWNHHHSELCIGNDPSAKTNSSLLELKTRALANDERTPFLILQIMAKLQIELDQRRVHQVYTARGSTLQGGSWDRLIALDHVQYTPQDILDTRQEYQLISQIYGKKISSQILSHSVYAQIRSIVKKNAVSLDVPTVFLSMAPAHRLDIKYGTSMQGVEHGSILPYYGAFFNHSCNPNTAMEPINGGKDVSWVALKEIGFGEEVTISYVSSELSAWEKREELFEVWGFWCHCPECETGSENNWGSVPEDLIGFHPPQ
eukprot:TRINITY_DN9465_c0_g1_i1.p1 TRINITY_DN9465_c0_g1~~TRINITY_DN9465_c0_g1_i1.p1  ORF type:complete len:431 (-),score=59.35 TRINITY_DN9465_c0_g1_i1:15-1307(-)